MAFAERQVEAVKRMVGEVQAAQDDLARGRAQHRKVKEKVGRYKGVEFCWFFGGGGRGGWCGRGLWVVVIAWGGRGPRSINPCSPHNLPTKPTKKNSTAAPAGRPRPC